MPLSTTSSKSSFFLSDGPLKPATKDDDLRLLLNNTDEMELRHEDVDSSRFGLESSIRFEEWHIIRSSVDATNGDERV